MSEPTTQATFLSRLLYHIRDDEPYWVAGTPPDPLTIAQACAAAKDEMGSNEHRAYFENLGEILDACIAEELKSQGSGLAATNAEKHPRVVALGKGDERQRAGIALAAAQGLAWYETCKRKKWLQDHSLRNQIAKRVMTAILPLGRMNKGYSSAQLAALARLVAGMRGMDLFEIEARGTILEILAANLEALALDEDSLSNLMGCVSFAAEYPANRKPVRKAIEKLTAFSRREIS